MVVTSVRRALFLADDDTFCTVANAIVASTAITTMSSTRVKAFNQQLHAQAEELKNATARAQKEATESQESAKIANSKASAVEREKEAIQNKLASANNEIDRLQQELRSSKELLENQINKAEESRATLLEKLDSEREMKNQAIGQRDILLKEVEQNRRDRADDNQKINQLQLEILNLKTSLQTEKQ